MTDVTREDKFANLHPNEWHASKRMVLRINCLVDGIVFAGYILRKGLNEIVVYEKLNGPAYNGTPTILEQAMMLLEPDVASIDRAKAAVERDRKNAREKLERENEGGPVSKAQIYEHSRYGWAGWTKAFKDLNEGREPGVFLSVDVIERDLPIPKTPEQEASNDMFTALSKAASAENRHLLEAILELLKANQSSKSK